jgi:hypothetical protein
VIVEMTDEEVFCELLLSNAQDGLRPLGIGLDVLKVVERSKGGRGKKGRIAEYARMMGASRDSLQDFVTAAKAAPKYWSPFPSLRRNRQANLG